MLLRRIAAAGLCLVGLMSVSAQTLVRAGAAHGLEPVAPASTGIAQAAASIVARVYYTDQADLLRLTTQLDVWEVHAKEHYIVAALSQIEFETLIGQGYRLTVDYDKTVELNRPLVYLPGQVNGIPGYPCYRTVEETFTTAQDIVTAHPNLAEWIDVGDTWDKVTPGGNPGYDLMVLKLTNHNLPGPKPKLYIMSSIHAREYTPAELNTRFAEYLVDNYGIDPDVTWLLDYNEIQLMLQANPDGRKMAETGLLWRKNVDNNYCANTNSRGADLNRNYPFHWGGPGASTNQCDETYRGPSAVSEPETQAVVNYIRSQYPDLRPDDLTSAAPITTSGVFMDLHSYSQLVLWPWGDTSQVAPNGPAMQTLGRKFAFFNNYTPEQAVGLYPTSGTTDDTAYGELGVPAFTIEMGTAFFETCTSFENTTLPANMPALLYAAKSTHRPYQTPAGPDVLNLTVTPTSTVGGALVALDAIANDTRFNNSHGAEPTQSIAAAQYTIDAPSWITAVVTHAMAAADGVFDAKIEAITANVDTTGLTVGRHTLFVEAQDADGNWGSPTAVFVWVTAIPNSAIAGTVVTQGSGDPIEGAAIEASTTPTLTFRSVSVAGGQYSLAVVSGTYGLSASRYGYLPASLANVSVISGTTMTQDIALTPAASYVVSGMVQDALTGQPLTATIVIAGYPTGTVNTDPATGFYAVQLAEGITYTFDVHAAAPGYLPVTRTIDPLTGDRTEDFALNADLTACTAPGYIFAGVYQTFDAAAPPGWAVVNNVGSTGWRFDDPGGRGNLTGGAGGFAIADSDNAGSVNMDTELRSPVMDLSTLTSVTLTFKTDFYHYSSEVADVDASVNGSSGPWTNVWRKTADYRGPKTEVVDLTTLAAGQSQVMLRFHYYNANYEWWWEVDEVQAGSCLAPVGDRPLVRPGQATQTGEAGATVTYTLQVTNTASVSDTFDVLVGGNSWPVSVTTPVGPLASNGSASLTATVLIPAGTSGGTQDVATVTVRSQSNHLRSAEAQLTTRAQAHYGVLLLPLVEVQSGAPGQVVTYTLQVTNSSNTTETFGVQTVGVWPQAVQPATLPGMGIGAGAQVQVQVTVPAGTRAGLSDTTQVTVTAQDEASVVAGALLTTTASVVHGGEWASGSGGRLVEPGRAVTYSLRLTNTGNVTETFGLGVAGNTWPTRIEPSETSLDMGAGQAVVVVVDVPAGVGGVTDVVTVTASYTAGVPVVASQAVLATTGITHGVQLEAVPPEQAGLVGAVVTYTLRVTNTGNVTDTYDLSASRNLWPVTLVPTSTRVAAQGSADVSVQVTIPVTATVGLTDVVRVMAAGTGVSDYRDLITTATAPNYRVYLSLMIKNP